MLMFAAIISSLLLTALPTLKNISVRIYNILISMIFVKVTISDSNNVSGIQVFNAVSQCVERDRINFLSRGFILDNERNVNFGYGFHTCYNNILYFVSSKYDGPYEDRGYMTDTKYRLAMVFRTYTIYTFFWNKNKILDDLSNVDTNNEKLLIFFKSSLHPVIEENRGNNISNYDYDDVNNLKNALNAIFDGEELNNKISIHSVKTDNLLCGVLNEMDANLFIINILDSYIISVNKIREIFDSYIVNDPNKKWVIYFNLRESNFRYRLQCEFNYLIAHECILKGCKVAMIMDDKSFLPKEYKTNYIDKFSFDAKPIRVNYNGN